MRRSAFPLLVASSLLLSALANAATRAQYGGALRISLHAAVMSLDPADSTQPDSLARRNLARLMFDTLVTLDDRGRIQPALASYWQAEPGNQRWQFQLRRGVRFHDDTPLTADPVAASLRAANPTWTVYAAGDSVVIQRDVPAPNLPAELALPRNGIAKRESGGKVIGTGPFHLADWQPGKKLTRIPEENYWNGRPFLDSIEIELGRSFREQMIFLDLGKADLIEMVPEQAPRAAMEGRHIVATAPLELVVLVFARDPQSTEEKKLRQALAASIDRASIKNVLLQGEGEPVGSLLPNWMTGYGFVFSADVNLQAARQARSEVRQAPSWTLGYEAADPLARLLAERIALNARDAGLTLQPTAASAADVRVVRIPLASADSRIALSSVAAALGLPARRVESNSAEDLYQAESALLATQRVIPLFFLPATYAVSAAVKNWTQERDGSWRLDEVWLGREKP